MGLTEGRVSQLKKQGMPVDSLARARRWYGDNVDPIKRAPPGTTDDGVDRRSGETLEQARTRERIALADQAEMDAAERRDELIEKAKVKAELAKQFGAIREGLLNIPARLAPVLHAAKSLGEVQTMLDTEIRAVLAQYVGEA